MTILDIIGSVFSGGVTGLLGVALQSVFGYLTLRAKGQHEVAMAEQDRLMVELEGKNAAAIAEIRRAEAADTADANIQSASYRLEPQRYAGERPNTWIGDVGWLLLMLVDVLRGSIRPMLTLWLAYVAWEAKTTAETVLLKVGYDIQAQVVVGTYEQIVSTLLYLFSTCVTWWFGSRVKALMQGLKG